MVDGYITIGTKLSTDKFDRQLANLEKKMKNEENKKIVIETQLQTQRQDFEDAKKRTDELADAYQRLKKITSSPVEFKKGFAEYSQITSQFGNLQQIEKNFNNALTAQNKIEQGLMRTESKYQGITDKVAEYKQQIESVKIQKQVADTNKLKDSFNNVGSSIQKSIRNVARLALGIFGIRSAFLAVRRAASDLSNYDPQFAANLEYIRYALTQAIAPILRYIVNLAATLLGYINAIVQAWFGINLFANASAKSFNKMKAGAGATAKAAKEIKKQLAGFDEMNVLTDNASAGAGGGAGGAAGPDFDLSKMQGEPPEWLQWIIDHKAEIFAILGGILGFIVGIKAGLGGIKALGIALIVAGIVYAVQALLDYLNDPSWKNFGKIIQGIGIAIIGLGVLIGSVPVMIAGAAVLIVGTIIKYWDKIKDFLQRGIDWLTGKSDWVHEMFGDTIGNIYDTFVKHLQLILDWFDLTFKSLKGILDGIIKFVKGVFTGDWKMAWEGIKQIFENIWNWIKGTITTILNMAWNMVKNFATAGANAVAGIFKSIVNAVLRTIENVLNGPIRTVNRLIGVINGLPGVNLSTLPTFSLPRLKVGGIINMPNKGTMIGSAIAGESGQEGVIPLTDTDAMATLGREIGKWININATVPVYVGNRQIAREIKKINAEDDFAYNA